MNDVRNKHLYEELRDAGAREIHLFITYPQIIGPCFYGIDMSSYSELIGAKMSSEEMAEELGADSVNYMTVDEYIKYTGMRRDQLCLGCISNEYPTLVAHKIAEEIRDNLVNGGSEAGRAYE